MNGDHTTSRFTSNDASTSRLVDQFPDPGQHTKTALEELRIFNQDRFLDDVLIRKLDDMPKPWDPASCPQSLRAELWTWLDGVAVWINSQTLWSPTDSGIPECWPAHPFIVHELATLACARIEAEAAPNPNPLQQWQNYDLPVFLERVRRRLGDTCQPGNHETSPRQERNDHHTSDESVAFRRSLIDQDGPMRWAN